MMEEKDTGRINGNRERIREEREQLRILKVRKRERVK